MINVEKISVDDLHVYANNSRTHSDAQIEQIAQSIKEFRFTNPVLIDSVGGIIAGHGRVMAAKSLGLEWVPCLRLSHLTDAQRRAYVIADNQLALNAGWDFGLLKSEIGRLIDESFDIDLLGFDGDFIDGLLDADDEPDDSEIQPLDDPELGVQIFVDSETEQQKIHDEMKARGYKCKVSN